MKKRFTLLLVLTALLLSTVAQAEEAGAAQSSPFVRTRRYEGNFTDVEAAWYADSVAALYEYGLTDGVGGGAYAPNADVKISELVTFSARIRAAYLGESIPARQAGEAWYQPYVNYLRAAGVLGDEWDGHYAETATRAQMAGIFAATLPPEWYDGRNADVVTQGYAARQYIKDVNDYTPYQQEILWLYKQGILDGVDKSGSFRPDAALKRSEVAALLTRILDPALRLTLTWPVLEYRSAAGTTYADLVRAPEKVSLNPSADDTAAVDALVRRMLAEGTNVISLQYENAVDAQKTGELARAFSAAIKNYCEQMYNSATCRAYSSGRVYLTFSSTACEDDVLKGYRDAALSRAIAIHDELWESGYLTGEMSQWELAKAYYLWLCENCAYDNGAVGNDSVSHLAYSALLDGVAVCDGYTGAYNLLLKLEGIECTALFNDDHIWTVATLDGKSYHIDTTWGDREGRVDLTFFGMTEEQSRAKHAW